MRSFRQFCAPGYCPWHHQLASKRHNGCVEHITCNREGQGKEPQEGGLPAHHLEAEVFKLGAIERFGDGIVKEQHPGEMAEESVPAFVTRIFYTGVISTSAFVRRC